ncbi:serine hydrolase [Pyrodictium abyssi]|uniref:Serine hydrolase n=1 Tax=Pyrodictium abyssi TaxID=54256 RepID=A0ABN6ZQ24_9CREN|nr:serine hydrolase [Pyrodictium abyssi]
MPAGIERLASEYIQARMSATRTPGVSVSLQRDGEPLLQRGYGYRCLEKGLPATAETVYGIASISKTITAVAVMQLVEKGLLSLDDPAEKYLPIELRVRSEPVRIWHLLSHTSGIPALGYAEALVTGYMGLGDAWLAFSDPRDVLAWLERGARHWALARPGERFFYLNEGYVALGVIVERLSGLRFAEYVRRHIAGPLGMRSTTFDHQEAFASPLLATPYDASQRPPRPARVPTGIAADGGGWSTVVDLARLMAALAGSGRLDGVEILSRSSVEEMERPRAELPAQLFGGDSYGLGVLVYPGFPGGRLVGHSGSLMVYTGFAGYVREKGVSVAVLANADPGAPQIAMSLAAAAAGADPWSLPFNVADRVLGLLEGVYTGFMGTVRVRVERVGDALLLESVEPPGRREVLFPERLDPVEPVFLSARAGKRLRVVFRVDAEKGVVELLYDRYRLVKAVEPGGVIAG